MMRAGNLSRDLLDNLLYDFSMTSATTYCAASCTTSTVTSGATYCVTSATTSGATLSSSHFMCKYFLMTSACSNAR